MSSLGAELPRAMARAARCAVYAAARRDFISSTALVVAIDVAAEATAEQDLPAMVQAYQSLGLQIELSRPGE